MKRKRKLPQIETLQGLPHPDSREFKSWLQRNIANFTELDYKVLALAYNRAKEAGDIP